ncbi:Uncharacterized protein OBRU01_06556 [Operophtera brumata]|uniref:Uncharacterized protein n=1 Tax=Operophtera brumata TaxID=104452 RepID=A0A0L7LK51_OPEBR|nr:Uncharacterized protein OBRU01_06556 [Operophtera brumata]
MGSNSSKSNNDTSVVTPKGNADVCDNSDPRSPTPEVSRTPIHNKSGSKHNITKNMDLRKTFESAKEEKLIHNNPILSAVIKNHLQSYDPRSPTQDFERTPIVISSKSNELKEKKLMRQHSENCASSHPETDYDDNCDSCAEANELSPELIMPKNLCEGFYDISLNESSKETAGSVGSSTASHEAIENTISNGLEEPTTLLETNFEYIDTDDMYEDSHESLKMVMADSSNSEAYDDKIPVFEILDIDPRSPSIGIDRTPIVLAKTVEHIRQDNVEEMSDDSLIKVLQNTNAELRLAKSQEKNEELLIYEDETTNINNTPKKSKSISNGGSRTPLSCMKNKDATHTRAKSANTLCDPKKESKMPKRVSHIPRLKSLTKSSINPSVSSISLKNISKASAMGGDCENTPPHSHRDRWDKDSSIVL